MGVKVSIGMRKNWFKYFEYKEEKDTPSEIRNILLIIFTLIAAVTFQAGVNPPSGVWQETELKNATKVQIIAGTAINNDTTFQIAGTSTINDTTSNNDSTGDDDHIAGRAIFASHQVQYYVFLIFNTMAFFHSVLVIVSLTYKFPFVIEIWAATICMAATYMSAINAVSTGGSFKSRYINIAAAVPFLFRFVVLLINFFRNKNQVSLPDHNDNNDL